MRLGAAEAALLRSELAPLEAALAKARRLASLPRGRFPGARPIVTAHWPVPFSNLLRTIPFSQPEDDVRRVAYLLGCDAILRAEDGDIAGAAVSVRAMFNAARSFGDEPSRLAQQMRCETTGTAMTYLERVLAQGEVPANALASFQDLLEDEEAHPGLLTALRGDRAAIDELFGKVLSGELSRSAIPAVSELPVYYRLFFDRNTLRENRVRLLENLNELVEAAKLPEDVRGERVAVLSREFAVQTRNRGALDRMRNTLERDLLSNVNRSVDRWPPVAAWRRTAIAAVAAERFRQVNDRWPKTLDELLPRWLKKVPADPFANGPVRLKRLDDGVSFYSVGVDRRDDGGKYSPVNRIGLGADVGFRLWDPGRRRQPPKPLAKAPTTDGR